MKLKYNSKGQILEIYVTISSEFIPYLLEDEFILDLDTADIDGVNYYIENKLPIKIPEKPNFYNEFNWTTKEWEFPTNYLEIAKKDYKSIVNTFAGEKIIEKYPTYRQINYNREPTAQTTIEMNLWVDGVRAESNIATSAIGSATDLATIEGIVDGFKAYLAGL
jgi:hypothetical protein